jgi:hypothetical protein
MTTTPEETRMPTDPNHRALLRAIDGLTTQVRRIADTLETPVTTDDDGAQTTGDDTLAAPAMPYKMCSASASSSTEGALAQLLGPCILRYQHYSPVHQDADGGSWTRRAAVPDVRHVTATMRENEQLRTELARINTRPDPNDGNISLTIGEQLAMAAQLEEATAAIERVRAIKPSPPRSEANARTNAQDEGWDQALLTVRAALIGPTMEDTPRLLSCGLCYEENGEEVHPHPECPN